MPRVKKAAATPAPKTTPATRRRRAKAKAVEPEVEEVEDEEPEVEAKPARRGRKAKAETAEPKAASAGRAPKETVYVSGDEITSLWDELEDGKDTRITINGDAVAPHGKRQIQVVDFVKSQGRKKVTAADAIADLEDDGVNTAYATWTVATCLNHGVISAA
jgi:hypothetical protein